MDLRVGSLSASFDTLPTNDEVAQVFKDYRKMLKVRGFKTPLQRAEHIMTRNCSIALEQKVMREVEKVFNLLPPGHYTRLKVDFFRIIATTDRQVSIRVPITLLSDGTNQVLLNTDSSGHLVQRRYTNFTLAFKTFRKLVAKKAHSKAHFPLYVHKVVGEIASFHHNAEAAKEVWVAAGEVQQMLQQFVQPFSKRVSLVRAHWKESHNLSTFYFICHGPNLSKRRPSLLTHMSFPCDDNEDFSAAINSSSTNLVVQKSRELPELDKEIAECVRLLNASLQGQTKVVEIVCDFVSDSKHQWVFLGCKGYRFQCKSKLKIETLAPKQDINLQYLMFPLVARKSAIKQKLNKSLLLSAIAMKRRACVMGVRKQTAGCSRDVALLGASSIIAISEVLSSEAQSAAHHEERAKSQQRLSSTMSTIPHTLITREVNRFENLVRGSRSYQKAIKGTVDIIEKNGGIDVWKWMLLKAWGSFTTMPEIACFFEEKGGFEETLMVQHAIERVLRGNYNFYYKEALGKLHRHVSVTSAHYSFFMSAMDSLAQDAQLNESDRSLMLKRFHQLEQYICCDSTRSHDTLDI